MSLQEGTSDTVQALNEEEIFDVQDKRSLYPMGWIHTHPTQTCFLSSIDIHTQCGYQVSRQITADVGSTSTVVPESLVTHFAPRKDCLKGYFLNLDLHMCTLAWWHTELRMEGICRLCWMRQWPL